MDEDDQVVDVEEVVNKMDSEDEVNHRLVRFNDMVASGMAEDDAYAVLADEHNFSDEVIAPQWQQAQYRMDMAAQLRERCKFGTRLVRKLRQAVRFALRY